MLRHMIQVLALLTAYAGSTLAQDYPVKPIRLLTAGAGGGSDITARVVAQGLSTRLGQPVVIDTRVGGVIIADIASKAYPDGYTLLIYSAALWMVPLMQEKPTYDAFKDFSPITLIGSSPMVLVVQPGVPAKSVQELITLAKMKPYELNYASGPSGATPHLAAELFKSMANVEIVQVTYRSVGAGMTDVLGGRVQLMFPVAGTGMPQIKSGKLRGLGVGSLKPSPLAPGLAPISEAGLPGYEAIATFGMFAPAKTPAALIRRQNEEMLRVLASPDVKEKLLSVGVDTIASSPEGLLKQMKADTVVLGKVIKAAKIRLD